MILIIVEGQSDRGFVKALCDRLNVRCDVKVARGNRPSKVARLAKAYMRKLDRVVVLKDVHERDSREFNKVVNGVKTMLEGVGIRGEVVGVKRSIESWALAGLCEESAEDVEEPGKRLEEKVGRPLVKSEEVYAELARRIDVDHASKSSKSFREFLDALLFSAWHSGRGPTG